MSGMCIAVIKMVRVKLTGRQPVRKHDNCDDRGAPDFMGVQTRQQIITTKRDKGGKRQLERIGRGQLFLGLRKASP